MRKLTAKERAEQTKRLLEMRDDQIDLSDIPEITPEQFKGAVRGMFYRPIKKPVTMRLDSDVIAWLKQEGRGYQTKANALLRQEMLRTLRRKNKAKRVTKSQRTA